MKLDLSEFQKMQVDEEQQKAEDQQQQTQPENKAESEEMEVRGAFETVFS